MMPRDDRDADGVLTPHVDGARVFVADRCANCLEWVPDTDDGLFCSDWCKEVCKDVRYFRRVIRDGRIADPDLRAAVRTRKAFLLAGGYNALGRIISPQVRAAVIERDSGVCQSCGAPGTDIDHIAGSSAGLDNLQLLCPECHRAKTTTNMVPAAESSRALMDAFFEERVFPDEPKLLADSEEWQNLWPALKRERRQRLVDEVTGRGIDITDAKTRADLILLRDDIDADYDEDEDWDAETASSDDGGFGSNSYFAHAMERDD